MLHSQNISSSSVKSLSMILTGFLASRCWYNFAARWLSVISATSGSGSIVEFDAVSSSSPSFTAVIYAINTAPYAQTVVRIYTVFQKKFTPRTFMITV